MRWAIEAALLVSLLGGLLFVTQPVLVRVRKTEGGARPDLLRRHVRTLSVEMVPRDAAHPENLDRCAAYIARQFEKAGAHPEMQAYQVGGRTYRNVTARFGPDTGSLVVVGAHYDAFDPLPAADDNASGVAGVLELARLLSEKPPRGPVELATYTLEEPPYFASEQMGSAVHAASLKRRGVPVKVMIAAEMIGRFTDAKGSQEYPLFGMKALYPSRGDFIALVGRAREWRATRRARSAMARVEGLKVRSITSPVVFAGIDLSDHMNYWREGYPALMLTDTAMYRNDDYHTEGDTFEKLDYGRMALVVDGLAAAVRDLAGGG